MEEGQILESIKEIMANTFKVKPANINLDSRLDEDLGLDSVDIMDSIALFEEKFQISILSENVAETPRMSTVQDLVEIVKKSKG